METEINNRGQILEKKELRHFEKSARSSSEQLFSANFSCL
jgi:hypothetical protein